MAFLYYRMDKSTAIRTTLHERTIRNKYLLLKRLGGGMYFLEIAADDGCIDPTSPVARWISEQFIQYSIQVGDFSFRNMSLSMDSQIVIRPHISHAAISSWRMISSKIKIMTRTLRRIHDYDSGMAYFIIIILIDTHEPQYPIIPSSSLLAICLWPRERYDKTCLHNGIFINESLPLIRS